MLLNQSVEELMGEFIFLFLASQQNIVNGACLLTLVKITYVIFLIK